MKIASLNNFGLFLCIVILNTYHLGAAIGGAAIDTSQILSTSEVSNPATNRLARWAVEEIESTGDKDTNGWYCVLVISGKPSFSTHTSPVCRIIIPNITTNRMECWGGFYVETYSSIELVNASGTAVPKTDQGNLIGSRISDFQITEMIKDRRRQWVAGLSRTLGFVQVLPSEDFKVEFSLPQLFSLENEGGYVLKVQTCLIYRTKREGSESAVNIVRLPQTEIEFRLKRE